MDVSISLLSQWRSLVPFLGDVLGSTAEVILETPEDGIIAVANGILMGHRVGDPLTPQTADLIDRGIDRGGDSYTCAGHNPASGKPVRRWPYFIRSDEASELTAVLSVYLDLSDYVDAIQSLTNLVGDRVPQYTDLPLVKEDKCGAVSSALIEMGLAHVEPHRLTESEKQQMVLILDRHGVFDTKGAVPEIASQLGVSDATIYRYLTAATRLKKREQAKKASADKQPEN